MSSQATVDAQATMNVTLKDNESTYQIDSYYSNDESYNTIMTIVLILNKYYLWIILAIGLPGNISTIFTISRMRSLGSFSLYVVLLAIADSAALVLKVTIYQLLNDQVYLTTEGCRILLFLATFFASYANWILVLMAVERLVAVKFPLKIQRYLGYKKSIMWNVIVGVSLAVMYTPILLMYDFEITNIGCYIHKEPIYLIVYLKWVNICLLAFIPFILIALFNVLILGIIRQSFKERNLLTNTSSSTDMSTLRQTMLMLFTSTLVFVILMFPACALTVAESYWQEEIHTRGFVLKYLFSQISYILVDSTHALNFYLYFLSARKFRKQFNELWTCKQTSVQRANLALKFQYGFQRLSLRTSTSNRQTAI
ncbi:G-protein coupled receptor daf-37-like [Physella acuta]|uniref:G-protein coupled receptor daf-37-like n=1 Tax=Physella acuta TaxID=109671 RepID=UPI0027DD1443|nr:G-protein coupled receptor daf-37-like [Physella acuta]